ncbi:transposase, Ptta/En/Spm, plant [Tanacetum coccineum]
MGKRIRIVSTKEVVQPAESTNQGQNISSDASDEASDPSVDKSLHQGAKKRVRGPTKKKEIWNLASDEKVLVTFNELCQPIGDEGNELTNFLGTLVRMPQHIGIHYPEWRKVPKEKKDDLWSIVKEKFSFQSDHSEKDIKEWIMSDMSTKWKCWKYELKKSSYDPTMTINEIVASQTDDRVETGQFRTLVESWFTEEKQVESERKKINRLKSIEPHVTGTKSFARVKDEKTKKNKGVSPSRGGMYCITRTRKDGSIVNAVAAQVVADIKAIGDSSSTDQETTNNSDWTNDDLSKVKGPERRGSVRCTGKFLVRNDKRSHDPQVPLLKAQVKYLRQGFMMFAAAVQEQVPNLNLSSVMNFMNMEVDDLSSIHDNTTGKNPSSASGTQNSHFSVHDTHPNKSDANQHHTSVHRKDGHDANQCPDLHTFARQPSTLDANLAEAFQAQCHTSSPDWFADIGASAHMTSSFAHLA